MKRTGICYILAIALFGFLMTLSILDEEDPVTFRMVLFGLLETGILALAVAAAAYLSI